MKKLLFVALMGVMAFAAKAQQHPELKTLGDSISYYFGQEEGAYTLTSAQELENKENLLKAYKNAVNYMFQLPGDVSDNLEAFKRAVDLRIMFHQMEKSGIDIDPVMFIETYNAAIGGPVVPMDTLKKNNVIIESLLAKAAKQAEANKQALKKAEIEANKQAGAEYVADMKKADKKIKTTASGLSYKQVKAGKGKSPELSDKVKVHYTGKLIDGTVFDSSVNRGEPATFGVSQLIKGFTEGLTMMKPGARYTLYIPSDLGYGDAGSGDVIKPGSTLVFDVELIEVNPQ